MTFQDFRLSIHGHLVNNSETKFKMAKTIPLKKDLGSRVVITIEDGQIGAVFFDGEEPREVVVIDLDGEGVGEDTEAEAQELIPLEEASEEVKAAMKEYDGA